MQDNIVEVDRSVVPNALNFAPRFNVAVPFIERHLSEGRAGKVAIQTVDEKWSYQKLNDRVNQYGNHLLSLGIEPGDRLMMVVRDCPDFIAMFFGAIKAGIIPAPVNTLLRIEDYQYLIADSACAGFVYSLQFSEILKPALEGSSHNPRQVIVAEQLAEDVTTASADLEAAATTSLDDCFWLYSSGSTGNPKGVVHPHRSMVCTSERFAKNTAGLREDDTVFSVSKLFHSYGFGNAMTFPLWVGATISLSDQKVTPAMSFEMIEKFRPTVFFGVPTLYAQQLRAMESDQPDLSSLRLCISAGEALPGDVFRRWKEQTGTLIMDGLGSTENLHIFISNRPDDYKYGTSGKPVSGYEIKLVDDNEDEITEPDVIGTVWAKGESAARQYWNNPEKSAAIMKGEWLNTGDMYYRDAEGYYRNAGRGDDMMKVGGLWCSPFEIEARLIEHPKVLEAAVVGHADEDGLLKPAAYVVLNDIQDAGDAMEQALVEHCREGLLRYKYPRWFHFLDDLPKTATGKIQRFKLREDG
ncbi:MAG: benzoate--CoA ligase [Rhodospirillaceae bacterium]|nr:benzoate--CoA ligase [Rhodospirillaceae bacterium]|tara:strand:- start:2221 stop:3795 length:1575 start_codon:yes stop_codon:yes gene_type:complete